MDIVSGNLQAGLPWYSVLTLMSFSKVHSTERMLVTISIIMQQFILPIRPSVLSKTKVKTPFAVLVLKCISELSFNSATQCYQHAYLASQPRIYYQGNLLTWLLSHAHIIKATCLLGFSAMHILQSNILTWLLSHAHTIKITCLPGFSAMHTLSR